MATVTVAGPFATRAIAEETAKALGVTNHSVYGTARTDADGFTTDECDWFVERDDSIVPELIFGLTWAQIQAKQQAR